MKSLEFENLPSHHFAGTEEPVVATDGNARNNVTDLDPSGRSIGNNTVTQNLSETTDQSGGSPVISSSNSGGASGQGSASQTHHLYEHGKSSRSNLPRQKVWSRDHLFEQIIGDPDTGVRTRRATENECNFAGFLSQMEPKKVDEALEDPDWVIAIQEDLNQFERKKLWKLVPRPKGKSVIGTKWVFRNKLDEDGIVMKNKARLVAKGYS